MARGEWKAQFTGQNDQDNIEFISFDLTHNPRHGEQVHTSRGPHVINSVDNHRFEVSLEPSSALIPINL